MSKTIQIAPYDPNWYNIFQEESKLIKQALGDNCLEVHHIGSTAVVGLTAKPKIDIIAVVKNGECTISPLEKTGFAYKGEWNIPFKFGFTKRDKHKINLHVFEQNHPEIELNIIFRDHLRSHPESLRLYAQLKEQLLANPSSSEKQETRLFSGYNLGKDDFIRRILAQEQYLGHRFLKVTHDKEWQEYHRICKEQLFDPIGIIYNPNHPSITANEHHHFILCRGVEVVTVAHIEFLSNNKSVLRSIATDSKYQSQGYNKEMIQLLKKWLKVRQLIQIAKK